MGIECPAYKSSKLVQDYISRVQKALNGVDAVIDREENTPRSLAMDFALSSLTILLSLQRLLEHYEEVEKAKGGRYNERWTDEENDILREFLPTLNSGRGTQARVIRHIAQRMGRTFRGVKAQIKKITNY